MSDTNKKQNENTVAMSIEEQMVNTNGENMVNFQNFSQTKDEKPEPIFLGESGIQKTNSTITDDTLTYRKLFFSGFFLLVVSILGIIGVGLYKQYLKLASQPIIDSKYERYVSKYKNSQNMLNDYIKFSDYKRYSSLNFFGLEAEKNIKDVINTNKLSYIQKKDIIQSFISSISREIISKYEKIESIKRDVTQYGFFPKEIYSILENQEYITSIKQSLLSLEIIKFGSAIKVFSFLPSFISELSESLNMTEKDIKDKISALSTRGEKDIAVYLNNCYLNPYEIDYDCRLIGDFDRYYNLISKDTESIDLSFFKKLIFYIDAKLEQTNTPSFSILFKQFDPKSKKINFSITINTSSFDEEAMTLKEGIINPHIFIFTNLLNLLKQSIFVISDSISIKQLSVNENEITEGGRNIKYHNSTTNFSLPIQNSVLVEITDATPQSKFILSE